MGSEFSIGSDSNVSSRLSRQQPKEEVKAIPPLKRELKKIFHLSLTLPVEVSMTNGEIFNSPDGGI